MRQAIPRFGVAAGLGLIAFILVALIVPGEIISPTRGNFGGSYEAVYEHGWPFVWGYRACGYDFSKPGKGFPDIPVWGIPWLAWDSWSLWEADRWRVRRWALACDLVLALVVLAVLSRLSWRWAARQFRFSLRALFCAFLLVPLPFAWWHAWARGAAAEAILLNTLWEEGAHDYDGFYSGPLWLKRLVGEPLTGERFFRVRHMTLEMKPLTDFSECMRHMAKFRNLESLDIIHTPGAWIDYEALSQLPRLRLLTLSKKIDAETAAAIAKLRNLEEVCLDPWDVQDSKVVQQLIGAMPGCRVVRPDSRTWFDSDLDCWDAAFWGPNATWP